jgi:predicted nucleic acid-binding protein
VSGLLDTSVFVAWEARRPLSDLPDLDFAVSSVTVHELWLGVGRARDPVIRAARAATATRAEATFEALPVDVAVARAAAGLRVTRGAAMALSPLDALIAGTALVHTLVLFTQDRAYLARPELSVVLV